MPTSGFLQISDFDAHAATSDALELDDRTTPILGLVGEVGSLVSAVKKKKRDADSFHGYRDAVIEEVGDVLWYLSAVARRGGTSLRELIAAELGVPTSTPLVFGDLASKLKAPTGDFELSLLQLAGRAGAVASNFADGAYAQSPKLLSDDLRILVRSLIAAAAAADVPLAEAASLNIEKREDRWPTERRYPAPLDDGLHIDEQLPRKIRVLVYEREVAGGTFVFQKIGSVLIGDRLTDNHSPPDDYRFHDVFHLGHAVVLGWSPTTRALLKTKRKSQKSVDENEDGARANLIEEGLTTWVFEIAKRHQFFQNTDRLGLDLLKGIKQFVRGYEAEKMPMWLWESAILQSYAAFRALQKARCGVVVGDLAQRKIWLEPLGAEDRALCGY